MRKIIVLLSFICTVLVADEFETAAKAYEAGDYQKTFKHSKIACDNGDHRGCYNLGVLYTIGQGIKQNYREASKYYKVACDNGNYKACYNLGSSYYNGQGARQNYSMAKEYYGKACDLGFQKGCDVFADLNQKGY